MKRAVCVLSATCLLVGIGAGQTSGPAANSDGLYQQLRHVGLGGESLAVNELVLKRDAAEFRFHSGSFQFLAPVEGRITGAVFVGDGELTLTPPIAVERLSLSRLTKEGTMQERFDNLVLRFTDDTAAELKVSGKATSTGAPAASLLKDSQDVCRRKLHYNLDARILQDVLGKGSGFFAAFIHGQKYSGKMLLMLDPHGAQDVSPEEVALYTYDENKSGIWTAFHYTREYANGEATGTQQNSTIHVLSQKLNTHLERSGYLRGNAETTFVARTGGLRAVPLQLYPTLRVERVTDAEGQPLSFIQEDKKEDSDFWVLLPKALAKDEKLMIRTIYEGKDAVSNEGGGNYYPVARSSWYPNSFFGDYADYDMTFSVGKRLQLVATGDLEKEYTEGDQNISVWKSPVPQGVAGFNFGEFKSERANLDKLGYLIEADANKELPNWFRSLQHAANGTQPGRFTQSDDLEGTNIIGGATTIGMIKKPLAEARIAVDLYTQYFGPIPYKRLAMTQQTACNFGQSWPELVYLPICAFLDDTIKHEIGLKDLRGYWRVVGPHEVAHQWWGHTVGFNSYRDQWMSEGFADFSAAMFIQSVWKNPQEFIHFWKDERELITEKNKEGFRAIDVGPVTLGYRLNNTRTGFDIARRLIYPKGAYILHMIRMMMWDPKTGDAAFRAMMSEFVRTYTNRAASTEDFKAEVEKHMTAGMNLGGNGKMDWFFNEYVYGTALPRYSFTYTFSPGKDGILMKFQIAQSGVDDHFAMPVPIYLELADGRVLQLGRISLIGNHSFEREVVLNGVQTAPKRAVLNYYGDVLAAE